MAAAGRGEDSYEWRCGFDSGRPCLDLMAHRPVDTRWLAQWLPAAGLVPPGARLGAPPDAHWAKRFTGLADDIGALVRGELDGRGRYDPAALARLNALAAAAPPAPRAVPGAEGRLVRSLCHPPDCAALLAAVARDTVELLTDPAARTRLRECQGDACDRVFLDTSRGRRRRWCSSERCGNRERVARHRARFSQRGPRNEEFSEDPGKKIPRKSRGC
ncbi:CGNR zinc finger domain-containing protein [Streptomyces sp. NPDC050856]|uniref:CGNR zinc finger domain-containing protein n=1 Tax=Streptomyces sp. NPDC050856 TaxID=3154939 RepID=UPI003406DC3C